VTLSWDVLMRRCGNGDSPGVRSLLLKAPEDERLAFGSEVEAGIKALTPDAFWAEAGNPGPGLALAVIGTMPSAARAAALLTRRGLRDSWRAVRVDEFLRIAAERELTWLGDLGDRLARRLPARDTWATGDWDFTATVLAAGGAAPPVTEGFVRGWLLSLLRPAWNAAMPAVPLIDRLRSDPHLDPLLPALFEIDGLGADIGATAWNDTTQRYDTARLPGVLAALAVEGRLDRTTLLASTVDRLVRGDRPHALRPFVAIHDALSPTVDEMASHALDYARLLAEANGAVAAMAQRSLRAVHDAGRLDWETLLEASGPALLRPEKALVKAQLTWLDKSARRDPARAAAGYETIAVAFGHPALDIQERALTMVGKALAKLDAPVRARLAGASAALAGDLPARAASLFGVAPAAPAVADLPAPVRAAPMPPPIADAAELAEEIAVLVHEGGAARWERVLAGLVSLHAAGDRDLLVAALTPVLDRYPGTFEEHHWNAGSAFVCLGAAIRLINGPVRERTAGWLSTAVHLAREQGRRGGSTDSPIPALPTGVLALRAAEIALNLPGTAAPMLVATPTRVNGSLDAEVLAARLARAEAEGWEPWTFDLEQALLRVPRDADPAVAAGLTSPAGRRFAAWLAEGGLPDPVSAPFTQAGERDGRGSYTWDSAVDRRMVATLRPARDGGLRLERQLLTLDPGPHPVWMPDDFTGDEDVLAMVLPHHREAAAAWALDGLAASADQDRKGGGRLLPLLADCTGPVGTACATGLAYVFGAKQEADRAAAVDAFLTLAAGAEPFAGAVGAALAGLCADSTVKLSRVVPALADAHRAGASAAVWELLRSALPPLLTTKVRAVPDLLELATQVAVTLGATDEIPGLAAAAARPGASRLAREAKRLLAATGGAA
jgi:hypothetical protein